jgi:hypothetical protein
MKLNMEEIRELEDEYGKLANVPDDHPIIMKYRKDKHEVKFVEKKKERTNMGKNDASNLNDILFGQLNRLNQDDLTPEQLKEEVERSRAVSQVANQIISNGRLVLDAHKSTGSDTIPKMLEG